MVYYIIRFVVFVCFLGVRVPVCFAYMRPNVCM